MTGVQNLILRRLIGATVVEEKGEEWRQRKKLIGSFFFRLTCLWLCFVGFHWLWWRGRDVSYPWGQRKMYFDASQNQGKRGICWGLDACSYWLMVNGWFCNIMCFCWSRKSNLFIVDKCLVNWWLCN